MDKIWQQYVRVLNKYAEFNGRAGRREFWSFVLVNFLIGFLIGMISKGLGDLYSLAVLIPSLAVGSRRLHDTGRSGWWQLLVFIPVIGWVVLIVWAVQKGNSVSNKYGSAPSK